MKQIDQIGPEPQSDDSKNFRILWGYDMSFTKWMYPLLFYWPLHQQWATLRWNWKAQWNCHPQFYECFAGNCFNFNLLVCFSQPFPNGLQQCPVWYVCWSLFGLLWQLQHEIRLGSCFLYLSMKDAHSSFWPPLSSPALYIAHMVQELLRRSPSEWLIPMCVAITMPAITTLYVKDSDNIRSEKVINQKYLEINNYFVI